MRQGMRMERLQSSDSLDAVESGHPVRPGWTCSAVSKWAIGVTSCIMLFIMMVMMGLLVGGGAIVLTYDASGMLGQMGMTSLEDAEWTEELEADDPRRLLRALHYEMDDVEEELEMQEGLFNIFTSPADTGSQGLYMEIPVESLGKPFIVYSVFARGQPQLGILNHFQAEQTNQNVFQFAVSHDGLSIEVQAGEYGVRAGDASAEQTVIDGKPASYVALMQPIALKTTGKKDKTQVHSVMIDGHAFFAQAGGFVFPTADLNEAFGQGPQIPSSRAFPSNINVLLQYPLGIAIHFCLSMLPSKPMTSRAADDRIGYFTTSYLSVNARKDERISMISKWNLRRDSTNHTLDPILYYIDPSVPKHWRSYVKQGALAWNPAFEVAGYKNAIRIIAPDDADFPDDYDAGDIRYSAITWALDTRDVFAVGFSTTDPRTGEILKANIVMAHGWVDSYTHEMKTFHDSTFDDLVFDGDTGTGSHSIYMRDCQHRLAHQHAEDATMLRLALGMEGHEIPLETIGAGIRNVIMHEVGHTLGLRHNFQGSSAVSFDTVTGKKAVSSLSSSVMDYLPVNLNGTAFSSTIGPYDVEAIKYGYTPVQGEQSGAQHDVLHKIATEVGYAFSTDEDNPGPAGEDPFANYFDLGSDPMQYYESQLSNAKRLRPLLEERLDDWIAIGNAEAVLMRQVLSAGIYASKFVGGVHMHKRHRHSKASNTPVQLVPLEKQKQALELVCTIVQDDSLFPSAASFERLVERTGFDCDSTVPYCLGLKSVSIHDIIFQIRTGLVANLLSIERMTRLIQLQQTGRDSNMPQLHLEELFSNITSCVGIGSTELELTTGRWPLASWWVSTLEKMAKNEDSSSTQFTLGIAAQHQMHELYQSNFSLPLDSDLFEYLLKNE